MDNVVENEFNLELHKAYLLRYFKKLPSVYSNMDSTRVVVGYFVISGLDVINKLDCITEETRNSIINWIYSLQVIDNKELISGFQGSTALNTKENRGQNRHLKWGHIATTYAALSSLLILGDDLSRVDRKGIIRSLKELQLSNGSYKGAKDGTEDDMRFVYCACCISYILNDWSGIDMELMVDFILKSVSYDGGIGQGPELESHSGSSFCAIASLALSNQLHRLSNAQTNALKRWLLNRVNFGFNGRPNKPADTCYSFWTGGALKILDAYQFMEVDNRFILATQDLYGGFSKWINTVPDPMHTYFGLAGLSLMGEKHLNEMHSKLNVTERTHKHLKSLHATWS